MAYLLWVGQVKGLSVGYSYLLMEWQAVEGAAHLSV